jgi:hypothetical protein
MPARIQPADITAMVISRSSTHVVVAAEISRDFLIRHVALLRELARLAEPEQPGDDD